MDESGHITFTVRFEMLVVTLFIVLAIACTGMSFSMLPSRIIALTKSRSSIYKLKIRNMI